MKELQILWASVKYNARKIKEFFVLPEKSKYDIQYELYWNAYRSWQNKRVERRMCNVGTDLLRKILM